MTAPLPGWEALLGDDGSRILARISELEAAEGRAGRDASAALSQRLRADGEDPALIAAALTLTGLRAKAASKFGEAANEMFFTQAGLEQASRRVVAGAHAARFARSGCATVADLGCGLGAETLAFMRAGLGVTAVEIDPLTAAFAERNLAVQASLLSAPPEWEVRVGDVTAVDTLAADAVFLDPARRTSGHSDTKRLISASDYSPSLDFAFTAARGARAGRVKAGGVKLGPGFDRELIPEDAEAEWVSVDGRLVEMALWFGEAARDGVKRAATVITGDDTHELTAPADAPDAEVRELGEYLIEPDGAVIRSRLIGLLAGELRAGMIHPDIAYLTADRKPETPFGQTFRILEELPSREKDLRSALAKRGIGALEIKKRGVAVDPATLRTRLRLKGKNRATLILTRSASRHFALLAERC